MNEKVNHFLATQGKSLSFGAHHVRASLRLLVEEECTLPFVVRYRGDLTGGLNELQLQSILDAWNAYDHLITRREKAIDFLAQANALSSDLKNSILQAASVSIIDDLLLPYKAKKSTLASRAIEKGLEDLALCLLNQKDDDHTWKGFRSERYIDKSKELLSAADVETGVTHIIAERISQMPHAREMLRALFKREAIIVSKAKRKTANTKKDEKTDGNSQRQQQRKEKDVYRDYMDFTKSCPHVRAYQVLALNRGEKEGILSVQIKLNDGSQKHAIHSLSKIVIKESTWEISRKVAFLLRNACIDSLDRLLAPSLANELSSELTTSAHETSLSWFSKNLRSLLLTSPVHIRSNAFVLGLDPGYRHGCKYAIINSTGQHVSSGVFHPIEHPENAELALLSLLKQYDIQCIALGNGTAAIETELFLNRLLSTKAPYSPSYSLVNEDGASIHSISEDARSEFPDLSAGSRSAVSIARRLMDPLAELVKVSPRHLGVGMYQHDIPVKRLDDVLKRVVESCVSSVGIDLNTASESLLRNVAGMNEGRARAILEYKRAHGPFQNREQLLNVKGIGEKVYRQSIGFLRVYDGDCFLDTTAVHPECYTIATDLVRRKFGMSLEKHQKECADALKTVLSGIDQSQIVEFLKVLNLEDTKINMMKQIVESLAAGYRYDTRDGSPWRPWLKMAISRLDEQLERGKKVTAKVVNIMEFGAFLDVGIPGKTALLHRSNMLSNVYQMTIGDELKVYILEDDVKRSRLSVSERSDAEIHRGFEKKRSHESSSNTPTHNRKTKNNSRVAPVAKRTKFVK